MAAIFISHSSRDNQFAAQMKIWLDELGYEQVFLDIDPKTGLPAGGRWESELYEKIARCHAIVLILTPNWLNSKWCFVEFAQARSLGKMVFPVVLSPLGDQHIAPEIQGVDLRDWNADGQSYLRRRLREVTDEIARGFPWDRSRPPYPGIHSFDAEDAAIFFGRDIESREVIERLEARRVLGGKGVLLILGASGSDKSSLMKAGVIPQLMRERNHWLTLQPFRPGRQPLTNLAKAVAEKVGEREAWRSWRDRLSGKVGLSELRGVVENLRVGEARNASLVIPVDQFEELFTIADPEEREGFLELMRAGAAFDQDKLFLVIATVRADVIGEVLNSPQFTLPFDSYALRPMPLDRVTKLIEGPATVASLTLEKGLAQRICDDLRTPGALPLLAFALREFYERYGKDRRLTISDYFKLGDHEARLSPIENAVRRRADDVLAALSPTEVEFAALKSAFVPHLVRIGDGDTFVRQPSPAKALPTASQRLIDGFVAARLLSKTIDLTAEGNNVVIEVSHEALFKAWPLLAKWLNEERAFLVGKAQLAQSLDEWNRASSQQKAAALLSGLNLVRAREWIKEHPSGLSNDEVHYIQASVRRHRTHKFGAYSLALSTVLVLGAVGSIWACGKYIQHTALECDLLAVRRQSFWDSGRFKLREALARLVDDVRRLCVGAASGVV